MFYSWIILENTVSEKVDSMESHIYQISTNRPSEGLYIGNFHRKGTIGPDSFAQLTWYPKTGLHLTMWSYDKSPLAKYENNSDPIHEDSCMACFINVFPRYRYKGYISLEFNANGVCRCSFGTNETDRKSITEWGLPLPQVMILHPTRDGGQCWMVKTVISKEMIKTLYQLSANLPTGHQMRSNFYSYCESSEKPYWGSWAPINKPNCHMPEFFGLLEIV